MARLRKILVGGFAIVIVAGSGSATAATVEASDTGFDTLVVYRAAPGETNAPTLELLETARAVSISDAAVPLSPGPGCTGSAGSTATVQCPLAKGRTGLRFEIALGDGDDSLDGTAVTSNPGELGVGTEILGEAGADRITTGPTFDEITPGPGDDVVDAGAGDDVLTADGVSDGADRLNGGPGRFDSASYAARTDPVSLTLGGRADDGAPGEGDLLLGLEGASGGRAGDAIAGGPAADFLAGGGGADRIHGGEGRDFVSGGGDADSLSGNEGADELRGGDGDDDAEGNTGGDRMIGNSGDDLLRGMDGNDDLLGKTGADELLGGSGADTINAALGTTVPDATGNPDRGPDRVDCGSGRDFALLESVDEARRCESTRTRGD